MSAQIADDGQLQRLESALARVREWPAAKQRRMISLISALEKEQAQLLHFHSHKSTGLGQRQPGRDLAYNESDFHDHV